MRVSEINLDAVKRQCRIDGNSENDHLQAILSAAIQYTKSYTGLSLEELEEYEDIPLAILCLCSDMYDVRQFTMTGIQKNPVAEQILASHSKNLL